MHIPESGDLRDLIGGLAGAAKGPRHQELAKQLEALRADVESAPRETVDAALRLLPQVYKLGAAGIRAAERFKNAISFE